MCDACDGMTYQAVLAAIRSDIAAHGWTVQYVLGGDQRNPSYAYTAGLCLYEHPELVYYSAHADCAVRVLGPLADAVATGRRRFAEGDDLGDFFPAVKRAELLHFPHSVTHLSIANDLFRRSGMPAVPALQLLWPERELDPTSAGHA